ncbi:hypothetical protein GALL_141270 [mine drainage metagenome]|uniref:Uncharacterized protein n=1 Tax=mine drainage metagenome TaxID=410659 RepID=A0A1J5SUK1_9ZZZZ
MELPLDPLSSFRPSTGTLEQWNAAYVRVEDYLRAHRIHNRLHQSRLILRILEKAARRHAQTPSADPTRLAAEETEREMDAWFGQVLGEADRPHERIAIDGRVALLLSDGPERWPYAFLDNDSVPPDFADSMRESSIRAGPDLAVSNMVPRPIDLGRLSEAAGETLERFERYPFLRMLSLWAVFIAALATIFYLTR